MQRNKLPHMKLEISKMRLKHVLLVGKPTADLANLEYLLQLSGCKVVSASDVDTAAESLLRKNFLSNHLDLILITNGILLMQFIELFSGVIRLRRRYPILVFDDMNFKPRIQALMADELADYDVRFCSYAGMFETLDRMFDFRLTESLNASI